MIFELDDLSVTRNQCIANILVYLASFSLRELIEKRHSCPNWSLIETLAVVSL